MALDVKAKPSAWKTQAIMIAVLVIAMAVFFSMFQTALAMAGGLAPLLVFPVFLVSLWVYWNLGRNAWLAWKISKMDGPVMTLTPEGICFHVQSDEQVVGWDEMTRIEWYQVKATVLLKFGTKQEGMNELLGRILGFGKHTYSAHSLETPVEAVWSYPDKHAPDALMKVTRRRYATA